MFDWINFLRSRNIYFTEAGDDSRGKAPGKNNIMVHCPFVVIRHQSITCISAWKGKAGIAGGTRSTRGNPL